MRTISKILAAFMLFIPSCAFAQGTGQLAAGQIWGNPGATKAPATATTIGAILDRSYSCIGRGDIMMRGASLWGCFVPGTSGLPMISAGPGADLTWARLPLASLALGTSDQLIGYFGATTGSALSINDCANALTYSTSTHTFGCNVAAGTGTVTNVATAGLATGGPITSTGTVTVTAASKSDQQTGTSTTTVVTPAQQQSHDSASKAWAYCTNSAGTFTLQASYNISGGTCGKTGTGDLTFTMTTGFSSAQFSCVASVSALFPEIATATTVSATQFRVQLYNLSGTLINDNFSVHCFGRQ